VVVAKLMVVPPKIQNNMTKDFNNKRRPSGSRKSEPRVAEKVLEKYLKSNKSRFAGFYPTTELCVDLKLMTCKPGRLEVGDLLGGVITRDGEEHYTFLENAKVMRRLSNPRNPIVRYGNHINIHRKADGTLYPTFNRPAITDDYSFALFCCEAAEELIFVAGLLGKEATK